MEDNALKKIIAKTVYEDGKAYLKDLEKPQLKSKPNYSKWLVAASMALLLGIGSFFVLQNKISPSAENLYAEYFSPYPNNYKPIVRGQVDETTLAFMAYENNDFKTSSNLFHDLLAEKNNESIRFYYAVSLLSEGKREAALKEFNKLESVIFQYQKQVLWYKGLALLKINKIEDAKQVFAILKAEYSDYKTEEVGVLLKTL